MNSMIFQRIYKPVLLPISSSIHVTSRFIYELVKKYEKVGLIFFFRFQAKHVDGILICHPKQKHYKVTGPN